MIENDSTLPDAHQAGDEGQEDGTLGNAQGGGEPQGGGADEERTEDDDLPADEPGEGGGEPAAEETDPDDGEQADKDLADE